MTMPSGKTAADSHGDECRVVLGPLTLEHPFINASGTMELFELAETFGPQVLADPPVAAYVPKTITLEARQGNPPPRILETAGGMINAIGLSGEGLDAFATDRLPRLLGLPCPLIISIGGFSVSEYVSLAEGLQQALVGLVGDGWVRRVGLELNISCPNVDSGCLLIGSDPVEAASVVGSVREVWPGLLVAKLTPNVTDIASVAEAAEAAGADAIAAVNTYKALVIDRRSLKPLLGNVHGGVSGPAIKPMALRAVFDIYQAVNIPIIGMGGVASLEDALEFMACGATAVAVGCHNFRDPWAAAALAEGLPGRLRSKGLTFQQVVGLAHR